MLFQASSEFSERTRHRSTIKFYASTLLPSRVLEKKHRDENRELPVETKANRSESTAPKTGNTGNVFYFSLEGEQLLFRTSSQNILAIDQPPCLMLLLPSLLAY